MFGFAGDVLDLVLRVDFAVGGYGYSGVRLLVLDLGCFGGFAWFSIDVCLWVGAVYA